MGGTGTGYHRWEGRGHVTMIGYHRWKGQTNVRDRCKGRVKETGVRDELRRQVQGTS